MATDPESIRFGRCVAFTRQEEGGYSDDTHDAGNWTGGRPGVGSLVGSNMGVTAATLARWLGLSAVTKEMIRQMPVSTFEAIGRRWYWVPTGCGGLPAGVDLMVFDYGWNCGASTSVRLLQHVLNLPEDGVCGPRTTAAASEEDRLSLIRQISEAQLSAYQRLPTFDRYGSGWSARTARRQQAALAMGLVLT